MLKHPVKIFFLVVIHHPPVRSGRCGCSREPLFRRSVEGVSGSFVLISPQPAPALSEAIPQDPPWIDSARLCTHSTLYQPCDPFKKSTHTSDIRACMSEEGAFSSSSETPPTHKKKETFKAPSSAVPPNLQIFTWGGETSPAERSLTFCMLNHSAECVL